MSEKEGKGRDRERWVVEREGLEADRNVGGSEGRLEAKRDG